MKRRTGAFPRRGGLAAVAAVAAASAVATMFLSVYGELLFAPRSAAADSWSRSALGHHAFLALARSGGWTVLVSRARTADKAAAGAAAAVLEPLVGEKDDRSHGRADAIATSADRLLLVLPKRAGDEDPRHGGWIAHASLLPPEVADRALEAMHVEATVFRPARSVRRWKGPLPAPTLEEPQLVHSDELAPLVATDEGVLVGELDDGERRVVVVADPDVFATHGLGRGKNAELALAVLDRLGGDRTLVVDETLHGWEIEPSLARELLRFPLVLATLQAAAALALLAWAALVRFGRPIAPAPLLRAGNEFLIGNVAEMQRAGGHAREAAAAYLRAAREEVLARVPPPGGAEPPLAWLARLEAARGRAGALASLERQVAAIGGGRRGAEEALRAARRIQRWREELTHGAGVDPREARGAAG